MLYKSISNPLYPERALHPPKSRERGDGLLLRDLAPPDLGPLYIDYDLPLRAGADGRGGLLPPGVLLRRLEALPHRLDHLGEPVEVQGVEDDVAAQVYEREPQRDELFAGELHGIAVDRHGGAVTVHGV